MDEFDQQAEKALPCICRLDYHSIACPAPYRSAIAPLLRTTDANARRETWEKAAKIAETYEHLAEARFEEMEKEKLCVNEYRGYYLDGQKDQAREIKKHLCAQAELEGKMITEKETKP